MQIEMTLSHQGQHFRLAGSLEPEGETWVFGALTPWGDLSLTLAPRPTPTLSPETASSAMPPMPAPLAMTEEQRAAFTTWLGTWRPGDEAVQMWTTPPGGTLSLPSPTAATQPTETRAAPPPMPPEEITTPAAAPATPTSKPNRGAQLAAAKAAKAAKRATPPSIAPSN